MLRELETGPRQTAVGKWFEGQIANATMQVETISLEDAKGWGPILDNDGKVAAWGTVDADGKPTGKSFVIEGMRVTKAVREVGGWDQTGIIEVVDPTDPDGACGTVGLFVGRNTGKLLVLAVAEPMAADPGSAPELFVNLRASVQGSFTNIQEHKVQNAELVRIDEYTHSGRLNSSRIRGRIRYGISVVDEDKVDTHAYQKQPDGSMKDLGENAAWFTKEQIDQALLEGVPMNGALNTALNLYSAMKSQGKI